MEDFAKRAGSKAAKEYLGDVLVLGLGKSGQAACEYIAQFPERVKSLTIVAADRSEDAERFAQNFVERFEARVLFNAEKVEGSYDLCITSPGISENSLLYKSAADVSAEIIGEVELAWRESPAGSLWVAITGTNGKTTVTSLTAHLLQAAGMRAKAVGNIGDTCLDAVCAGEADVFVAEVSSYQLASTVLFAPNVAVVLNITPDHLSWHGSFEAYRDAKFKVLANLASVKSAVAVLDATNDVVREKVRELRVLPEGDRGFSYIPLGAKAGLGEDMREVCGSSHAAFVSETGEMCLAFKGSEHRFVRVDELQIKGEHNVSNALAATCAARVLGAQDSCLVEGLRTFAALEHRIEPCGSVRGIECYNDSKATNVDATLKALKAFPGKRVVVLLGGYDKGTDLAPLVQAVHEDACAAVCFGAAGGRFAEALLDEQVNSSLREKSGSGELEVGSFCVARAKNLKQALDAALSGIAEADVILLSPACASFDEFSSFEERGQVFKDLVAAAQVNKLN